MLRIGKFPRLSGLSADTLYHYEDLRILVPASVDPSTGYRAYEAAQLLTVNKIMALKDAVFSLEVMEGLLHVDMCNTLLIEKLEEKVREICHKGDRATEDPNEYITEIQIPIK